MACWKIKLSIDACSTTMLAWTMTMLLHVFIHHSLLFDGRVIQSPTHKLHQLVARTHSPLIDGFIFSHDVAGNTHYLYLHCPFLLHCCTNVANESL